MINLTVINKKQLGNYVIKLLIVFSLIILIYNICFTNFFKNSFLNNILKNYTLTKCIDKSMVLVAKIKEENKVNELEEKLKRIEPYKLALRLQIAAINNLIIRKENQEEVKSNENETTVKIEQAKTGLQTEVLENNVPNKFTDTYESVKIKNESKYDLTEEMVKPDVEIQNKNVVIFHTHTCESYTATEKYNYEQTGTFRTTDNNFNVVRVGTELENQLKSYNFNVIHDNTYHDYPAYNGSYGRSQETVDNILSQNQDYEIVLDIHRDAIGDYTYAPTVKIGDEYAAQLMFVMGSDGGGLKHDNWVENLKFAIKVQEKANELYPGLFKPIILRNSRYNQQVTKGASIIEVGATGNTLEQCLVSMKYLAKVLDEVVK